MELASRIGQLGTESAFEVLAKARALEAQGKSIIHLEIGEPDFPTPDHIKAAAVEALRDGATKYCQANGLPELRQAIAEDVYNSRGVNVSPENIVVTPGAKPIIFFGIMACVEPGDEVLYPNPSFPIYESVINYTGAVPVPYRLGEENEFRTSIDELKSKITPRTRMLILNSPHNPTGSMLSQNDLKQIADLVRGRKIYVMADEVYSRILYEGTHASILSEPDMLQQTLLIDGFSKTYSMTGWRLGYGVVPENVAKAITLLVINSNSCTAAFVQRAGVAALKGPQDATTQMVAEFKRRRDFIVQGFNRIKGMSCTVPHGAFYSFPSVKATGIPSKELADYLLSEAGVACLNGAGFGIYGEGYLRFSYANSLENIGEALDRVEKALAKR